MDMDIFFILIKENFSNFLALYPLEVENSQRGRKTTTLSFNHPYYYYLGNPSIFLKK